MNCFNLFLNCCVLNFIVLKTQTFYPIAINVYSYVFNKQCKVNTQDRCQIIGGRGGGELYDCIHLYSNDEEG